MLLIVRLVAVEECETTNEDAREASALIMALRRSSTERMWSRRSRSETDVSESDVVIASSAAAAEHFVISSFRRSDAIEQSSVSNDRKSGVRDIDRD